MRIILFILCIIFLNSAPSCAQQTNEANAQNTEISEQNTINWAPYIKDLEKNIKKNWNPPRTDVSNSVKTSFKLSKDGNLVKCNIVKSSGNKAVDDAAIFAIKSTMPYKPFPENAKLDTVDIEFTFDYNVLEQKMRTGTNLKVDDSIRQSKWVNIQEIKQPIRLLDTDNIYKLNHNDTEGTVFRLRFIGKNKTENVAAFFADFENEKAGVISIKTYDENADVNFAIVDELNMKNISDFKTDFTKIKAYAEKNDLKMCPKEYLTTPLTEKEKVLLKTYIKKTGEKITKNWNMPKNQKEAYAVVKLKINQKGKIEECKITQSSNNEMFNETVLQAIKLSEPFSVFPKGYEKDFIQVSYVFGYNSKLTQNETYEKLYKVNTAANVLGTLLLIPLMILGID